MGTQVILRRGILLGLVLFACVLCSPALAVNWDIEFWQSFHWKNWECGRHKLYTVGEFRLRRDITRVYYYRISECYAYQALHDLTLEAHYSFIYYQPHGTHQFIHTNRLEFEANPSHTFANGIKLHLRNRLELLKRQNVWPIQFVMRERLMATFPVKCCGALTAYAIYDEVSYDLQFYKFTQNRFSPISLYFTINDRLTYNAYFFIRDIYSFSQAKWYRSFVFGSEFQF